MPRRGSLAGALRAAMMRIAIDGFGTPFSLRSEHGLLHGQLELRPAAAGLVVVARASETLDTPDALLASHFHRYGLSTLSVDLLSHREERYADVRHDVPRLTRRLLGFLDLLRERIDQGEIGVQAIGLHASHDASPAAVRAAALRDRAIAALVCRGGLIDLAGTLYLHTLASPLLILAEDDDATHTASNRRALREVSCARELRLIPAIGNDYTASPGLMRAAEDAAGWFVGHFASAATATPRASV